MLVRWVEIRREQGEERKVETRNSSWARQMEILRIFYGVSLQPNVNGNVKENLGLGILPKVNWSQHVLHSCLILNRKLFVPPNQWKKWEKSQRNELESWAWSKHSAELGNLSPIETTRNALRQSTLFGAALRSSKEKKLIWYQNFGIRGFISLPKREKERKRKREKEKREKEKEKGKRKITQEGGLVLVTPIASE